MRQFVLFSRNEAGYLETSIHFATSPEEFLKNIEQDVVNKIYHSNYLSVSKSLALAEIYYESEVGNCDNYLTLPKSIFDIVSH